MQWDWQLLQQDCTGCGICADVCPHGAIHMPREAAYPQAVAGRCTGRRKVSQSITAAPPAGR